jgi:LmbE family N-acetylglucosaminyl deacetylase
MTTNPATTAKSEKRCHKFRDPAALLAATKGTREVKQTASHLSPLVSLLSISSDPGRTLNFVAHEDDDLLFLSPDLLHAIETGRVVRTVYVTAGDAGDGETYWEGRQSGMQAAYSDMTSQPNVWTEADAGIPGFSIPVYTLTGNSNISLAFMHLPDGNVDGSGFPATGNVSIQDLWQGTISSITTVDGANTYTKATLQSTLTALMTSFQPDQVKTQDFVGTYGDGDHSDHHTVAYFTQAAIQNYTGTATLTGYLDYLTSNFDANISGPDVKAKQFAFYAYAQYDPLACFSLSSCSSTTYAGWLKRQYTVSLPTGEVPVANAGSNQSVGLDSGVQLNGTKSVDPNGATLTYQWTQVSGTSVFLSSPTDVQPTFTSPTSPSTLVFELVVNNGQLSSTPATVTINVRQYPINVARNATATASSENTADNQGADKAIDGVVDGYPRRYTKEWATVGGGAGSWILLTWPTSQIVNEIVLYDRPNLNDQITGGNVVFSDGSSFTIGTLNNNGSANVFTFAAKTIISVQLNITSVSSTTQNIGLAEFKVFGITTGQPTAEAGPDQIVGINSPVQLDGSGSSDPNGLSLTYQWTQTEGDTVTLSDNTAVQPTFTTPADSGTLAFQLVVNNGQLSSSISTVYVSVEDSSDDVALSATATASSENTSTGQTASKAIDGVVSGYPSDPTAEWATVGGGAGSWLLLTWSSPVTFDTLVLYDRPNLNDQITGGNIVFSDGSTLTIGTLINNGSANCYTFPAKTVISLQLNITSVSSSTQNIGLSEIQLYEV